jgi:hypothetical protein
MEHWHSLSTLRAITVQVPLPPELLQLFLD